MAATKDLLVTLEILKAVHDSVNGKLDEKTAKTRIDFDGTKFTMNGSALNYKQLHDIHLTNPDFAFVVYGDRAYLLSYVQDDTSAMREMRFQSVIAVTGSDNLSYVKTSGIYVQSSNGTDIASVKVTDINSESNSYKATQISDANKGSNAWYPSVKAVYDYMEQLKAGTEETAMWHLGFYLDENGDLCQKED